MRKKPGAAGLTRIIAALAVMIGVLASTGAVTAQEAVEHSDAIKEISFTIDNDGIVKEPEVVSQNGPVVTFKDFVTSDVVEGDISGSAVTHWDKGRIHLEEDCSGEECIDALFANEGDIWGTIEIETEAGRWSGQTTYSTTADGDAIGYMFLIGHGAHAGQAIVAELQSTSEDVPGVQFTGEMLAMDGPEQGVNIYFDGCAVPPDQGAGAMIMRLGDGYDSGSWWADYLLNQPGGAAFADVTLELDQGTISAHLLLQAHGKHRFGYFMITGGTGEYEGLSGFGKINTGVNASGNCANNAGLGGYWIGRASVN